MDFKEVKRLMNQVKRLQKHRSKAIKKKDVGRLLDINSKAKQMVERINLFKYKFEDEFNVFK